MSASGTWKEAKAGDGRTYYYHTGTNETTWTKPADFAAAVPTPASAWRTHTAPDGRNYYEDTINKKTQWDMPEVLKGVGGQEPPAARSAPAPAFVASTATNVKDQTSDFRHPDRNLADRMTGFGAASTQKEPQYTLQEAEPIFFKLLKRVGVESDWTWEQTVKAAVRDPAYRAFEEVRERKNAFERYIAQVRSEEKDREKERQVKLRDDFMSMLKSHSEINFYTRWTTARPTIEEEMVFKAAKHEDERIQLFNEYRAQLFKEHTEQEAARHKLATKKLEDLLPTLNITPSTRWTEAQETIASSEQFESDKTFKALSKLDILKAFEAYQKHAEQELLERRREERFIKARRERQNRDQYNELLRELRSAGKIKANTKWSDIQPLIEEDARYDAMLGQSGSSPLELFWDAIEEEDSELRKKRNVVYDVLEAERYEMTTKTTFGEFKDVMLADKLTASYDKDTLNLIYDRLMAKVHEREEKERQKNERHHRHAMDDLRSRIKRLEPAIRVDDSWEQVRPRLEKYDEFHALESDDLRRSAFEKHIRRLKEREEDERRDKDREQRNNHSRRHRTATPEIDAYEADRRKAQAARERSYGKRGIPGVSPPPRSRDGRDWDGADRYDGRDRKVSGSHYDRDRRDREVEREQSYRSRADPKERTAVLDYDLDERPGSGSRRRRDSDDASVRSRGSKVSNPFKRARITYDDVDHNGRLSPAEQRLKRYEDRDIPSPREPRRSKTPVQNKEPEQGFHSGSEEGEIEED